MSFHPWHVHGRALLTSVGRIFGKRPPAVLATGVLVIAIATSSLMAAAPVFRFDGFYVREDSDGSLARMSGTSQYIRFYPDARILRLYVPYPRSTEISEDLVRLVFDAANRVTAASAYLRDDFGILDEAVVVHLDKVRMIDGRALFDCGLSAPCEVLPEKEGMALISPGLVREHRVQYRMVAD